MPFSLRPFRRFPVCCPVTYHAGLREGHGIIWNLSLTGWRLFTPAASRADVSLDRQLAEPTTRRCGGCDRAVGPGPGVRPGNLGG